MARYSRKCGHLAVERRCPYNLSYIIFLVIGRRKTLVEKSTIQKDSHFLKNYIIFNIKFVIFFINKARIKVPNF